MKDLDLEGIKTRLGAWPYKAKDARVDVAALVARVEGLAATIAQRDALLRRCLDEFEDLPGRGRHPMCAEIELALLEGK